MSQLLQEVQYSVARHMDEILSHFKAGALITVIVRTPGNDRADFCLTSDTIDDAIALLARRKEAANGRPANGHGAPADTPLAGSGSRHYDRDGYCDNPARGY